MAERTSPLATAVAESFLAHGHMVHTCGDDDDPGGAPCAALRSAGCPLDDQPIDVAVAVGPSPTGDQLGEGDLCAVRRRIPLVLLDRPVDRLRPWAAAVAPASQAVDAIGRVRAAVLPHHSSGATAVAREELRRLGRDESAVDVEVRRSHGGLQVGLSVSRSVDTREAEKLAVHVCQYLRLFDPWAKSIDASVHGAAD